MRTRAATPAPAPMILMDINRKIKSIAKLSLKTHTLRATSVLVLLGLRFRLRALPKPDYRLPFDTEINPVNLVIVDKFACYCVDFQLLTVPELIYPD